MDSISNEPLPFTRILFDDKTELISDFDGNFYFESNQKSTIKLTVSAVGYLLKSIEADISEDSLIIKLKPTESDLKLDFVVSGKPTDTLFFDSGEIQRIKYLAHDETEYFKNGQKRFESVHGSTRTWFESGQLKHQSILKNNHYRIETEWYKDGQKKAEGSKSWQYKDKRNEGEWFKNDDWKYWNKKEMKK